MISEALNQVKCKQCGFQISCLDAITRTEPEENNNYHSFDHIESGLPTVLKEIHYVKNVRKPEQYSTHKFMNKKRNFLVKQINLCKKIQRIE